MKLACLVSLLALPLSPTSATSSLLRTKPGRSLPSEARQQEKCSTTEEYSFTSLFVIDFMEGTPGLWDEEHESVALEQAIKLAYACNRTPTGDGGMPSYYELFNLTVIPPNIPSGGGPFALGTIQNFSVAVFVEGRTNLTGIEDGIYFIDDVSFSPSITPVPSGGEGKGQTRRKVRGKLNQGQTRALADETDNNGDCSCPLPSKQEFLANLSRNSNTTNTSLSGITDVQVSIEVDCTGTDVDGYTHQDPDIFEFESGIALSAVGEVNEVDEMFLQTLAQSTASAYNSLSLFKSCDPQFRHIVDAYAVLGPVSIQEGGSAPIEGLAGQEGDQSSDGNGSNNRDRSLQQSTTPSLQPSMEPTAAYAPDMFTILIGIRAKCRGCPEDTTLFDQQTAAVRQLLKRDTHYHQQNRELGIFVGNKDENKCYCLPGTEESEGITESEFSAAFKSSVAENEDLIGIDTVSNVEEVRIFDCPAGDVTTITGYIEATFLGDLGNLTELEILQLEVSIIETYKYLQSQVCDPLLRSLSEVRFTRGEGLSSADPNKNIRRLGRKLQSQVPSITPTATARPSSGPTPQILSQEPTLPAPSPGDQPDLTFSPTATLSASPGTSLTTASPTSVFAVDDMGPTHSPTSEPTFSPTSAFATDNARMDYTKPSSAPTAAFVGEAFSAIFEIVGHCTGCPDDATLFDQIRRLLRQNQLNFLRHSQSSTRDRNKHARTGVSQRTMTQMYHGEDICSCGVNAPDRGVSEATFVSQWGITVDELNLPNVLSLEDVDFFDDLPSNSPSLRPSARPTTLFPSEMPSEFPSEFPTEMPTEIPTEDPSPNSPPSFKLPDLGLTPPGQGSPPKGPGGFVIIEAPVNVP